MKRALAAGLLVLGGQALAQDFTTRAEAMSYIATTLPKATADNPKYLTKADGTVSVWLTESVSFSTDANSVTMRERYAQTKDGKTTEGRHEAAFSLAEVKASAFSAPWDATPAGEPAEGLLFACLKPGCVAAVWGDAHSRADKADIYVQDRRVRARLLAAFLRLQTP